ncbi:3'(2'),5'-bisphosphate nucleotidase CysQ [Catenovulum maritimum]|uniref:3'(2'),5'-bisphosphate nucleotidase CysQ n=1 Tax=Catenovulum maritimum TaxID=1513271 RepID=A0A0J8GUF9_9ALTE|nr:3'(2'),5'-bisphosphate nucleotidase CysQ [Catenovulum maritimum]KMT64323.1 3'-5'-bisphosphate nucleotidase [Catenovulum maritimum]
MTPKPKDLLEQVKQIAYHAGEAIMQIYKKNDYDLYQKDDESPVTSADYAANEVLVEELKNLAPDIPIISEEMEKTPLVERQKWKRYWLLDPMDGTQEFVSRSGDFAVNIALIENHTPVLGVIYWPTKNTWYFATKGNGAYKQIKQTGNIVPIQVTSHSEKPELRIAVSRVQKSETIAKYLVAEQTHPKIALGSCSLKNCLIAEGNADFYLRIGPTGEWDTGASHCILREAGGEILDAEFNPITYNQRDTLENPDFIVMGDQNIEWQKVVKPHKTHRKLN